MSATPADVAAAAEIRRARTTRELLDALDALEVKRARIRAWNEQILDVVDTMLDAFESGRGVIIRVSHAANSIDARGSHLVPAGLASIFDLDLDSPRPITRTINPRHLTRRTP